MNTPEFNHAISVFTHLLPVNHRVPVGEFIQTILNTYSADEQILELTAHLSSRCVALTRTHTGVRIEYK